MHSSGQNKVTSNKKREPPQELNACESRPAKSLRLNSAVISTLSPASELFHDATPLSARLLYGPPYLGHRLTFIIHAP